MGFDLAGLAGGLTFAELTISDGGGADTTISITATCEILTVVQGVTQDLLTIDDFTTIAEMAQVLAWGPGRCPRSLPCRAEDRAAGAGG